MQQPMNLKKKQTRNQSELTSFNQEYLKTCYLSDNSPDMDRKRCEQEVRISF